MGRITNRLVALAALFGVGCGGFTDFNQIAFLSGDVALNATEADTQATLTCCPVSGTSDDSFTITVTPVNVEQGQPGLTDPGNPRPFDGHRMRLGILPSSLSVEVREEGAQFFRDVQRGRSYRLPAELRISPASCHVGPVRFVLEVAAFVDPGVGSDDPFEAFEGGGFLPGATYSNVEITVAFEHVCDPPRPLDPRVAMDGHGNGVVVWEEHGAVVAEVYRAGIGFLGSEPISRPDREARSPDVAMGGDGSALAVWLEVTDPVEATPGLDFGWRIFWSRWDPMAGAWSDPRGYFDASGDPPSVALDEHGDGGLVFRQGIDIYVHPFEDGGFRGSGARIDTLTTMYVNPLDLDPKLPRLALDPSGDWGVVVAEGHDIASSYDRVFAAVWTPVDAGELAPATWLDGGDRFGSAGPDVAIRDGMAIAVWETRSGIPYTFANVYENGAWGGPGAVALYGKRPRVDVGSGGEGVLSFVLEDVSGPQIASSTYDGGVWSDPLVVADSGAAPSVAAAHVGGGGFVLYGDASGSHVARAARFDAETARPGRPVTGGVHDGEDFACDLAGDASGTFLGAWEENGVLHRFAWLPPTAVLAVAPEEVAQAGLVTLDGSGSTAATPGAFLETFRFDPGDGTGETDTDLDTVAHAYLQTGKYVPRLAVMDDWGLWSAGVTGKVTVTATPGGMVDLTIDVKGGGSGSVSVEDPPSQCRTMCTITVPRGTRLFLRGDADAGSVFSHWTGADLVDGEFAIVDMDDDRTVEAFFE